MNFKNWLESFQNIKFTEFWNDGTIVVYINNIRYVYLTDAVFHKNWEKIAQYKPFDVLNNIKNQIKNGQARQIEPKNVVQQKILPKDFKNKQKTLF